MDSKIEEFTRSEKQTNTDYALKCVAKKFWKWLSEYSKHKDEREKVCLSSKQHKAFRAWKYDLPPHHLPPQLIDDNIFARFLIHCLVKLKNKKSPLRLMDGFPLQARENWLRCKIQRMCTPKSKTEVFTKITYLKRL